RELSNIERIDVVKGPASTLYGRMEPGGLVNLVTKQPLATPYAAIDQSVGAFNFERTQIDLGGPLTRDATVQYRLNAAHE
ncbi:TonB-dependent siderophore receptor, partial [Pseudomonas sp. GW531-E2]|uniref:TonB-dependent receptor plug domain-containing protein n=1 Tax=Pseudomonas sp. GW531-E2 TaxID=2070679 RepID=UPI000CAD4A4C